jgi:hypothetical protein
MARQQRTNIYLTLRQLRELRAEARTLGISRAELIRRILDAHLMKKPEPQREEGNA